MTQTTALTTINQNSLQPIIDMVINGLDSDHSKRAYSKALYQVSDMAQHNRATGIN